MAAPHPVGALFTDLYEVTMAQAFVAQGMSGSAVFEAFFRRLPPSRSYVLAAGLQDLLDFLEAFRFEPEELEYLRGLGLFSDPFLERLSTLRFTGDVWAVPEGTAVFPNEPLVQVIAPIVEAARGRAVVDFGSRHAHGTDAALKAARASYLAGAAGTSNLMAARRYGIPAFGTMGHSFVQAFESELAAFAAFAGLYPGTTLLVDTYDTLRGIDRVSELARQFGERFDVRAVRLDSGDLAALSRAARSRLDAAGLDRVQVFVSSDLDEYSIAALVAADSPIEGFGVGTRLALAEDAPSLDMAYKLVSYLGTGRTKLSADKTIYPGRKQIFRRAEQGLFRGDTIGQHDEALPGEPLLVPVMKNGVRLPRSDTSLCEVRRRVREQVGALPSSLRSIESDGTSYPLSVSDRTTNQLDELRRVPR